VQAHPQKFGFDENPGKIPENSVTDVSTLSIKICRGTFGAQKFSGKFEKNSFAPPKVCLFLPLHRAAMSENSNGVSTFVANSQSSSSGR